MATSKQMTRPAASRTPDWRRACRVAVALIWMVMISSCSSDALVDSALVDSALVDAASDPITESTSSSALPSSALPSSAAPSSAAPSSAAPSSAAPSSAAPSSAAPERTTTSAVSLDLPERPSWLGTIDLTLPDGSIATGLATPPELLDRRFATFDLMPPPALDAPFDATIGALDGAVLEASTWEDGCPVPADELRLLTMSFWGFDELPHTGEMIVHADVAEDVVEVFHTLFDARFPIEEMRIITDADMEAPNSGDGNVTSAFVCRSVRGGSSYSEHASGLAIDINPFLNPYVRGEVLLPELARHYLPRDLGAPGQITEGDVVVEAFADIGWKWGGDWSSLVDYQHFSLNNR